MSGQLEKAKDQADIGRDYGTPTVRIPPTPKVIESYRLTASQQGMFPSLGSDTGEDPNVFVHEPLPDSPQYSFASLFPGYHISKVIGTLSLYFQDKQYT